MYNNQISDKDFSQIRTLLYNKTGITLSDAKKTLVAGRLSARLRHYQLANYTDYFNLLQNKNHSAELQIALDLLTTNETYFFRENTHFELLKTLIEDNKSNSTFRVWSAACSSGQEAYSIAMLLAEYRPNKNWEIVATDISTRVLEVAKQGLYPLPQAEKIPLEYLKQYCLKGVGDQDGKFLIEKKLRERIQYLHTNLNGKIPDIGEFDVIFLRNVMIYFDMDVKEKLIKKLEKNTKSGGYLLIGHSESLNGMNTKYKIIAPSVYRKE